MRKRFLGLLTILCTLCALILLGGCAWLDIGQNSSSSEEPIKTAEITAKVKYEGEADEICKQVRVGEEYTLHAYDTEEYAFWFWESDGEKVSEEAEYTFTVTENAVFEAVFTPKAEDMVLINAVYERDEYSRTWYAETGILGEGYVKKGEPLCLRSEEELAVSWFTLNGERTRGPILEIAPDGNVTVKVEYEHVIEIVLAESEHYTLQALSDFPLVNLENSSSYGDALISYDVEDGYVADKWVVKAYASKEALTNKVHFEKCIVMEDDNTEFYPEYSLFLMGSAVRYEVSLVVDNVNVMDTYHVEIISEDGSGAQVISPEKFLHKPNWEEVPRGYMIEIIPNEDSYIQHVDTYITARGEETQGGLIGGNTVQGHCDYTGGKCHIGDVSAFGAWEDTTVRVYTIKKENAAIVNVISCNDEITYTPNPMGGYAPSMSTQTYLVRKGDSWQYYCDFDRNLNEIYEEGYQVSHIENELGEMISPTISFRRTIDKDENFYIHYSKKPIKDAYFDYHLTDEGDGYAVRLNPLLFYFNRFVPSVYEVTVPAIYNGKPVVEVPDFGLSFYQTTGEMRDDYGIYKFKRINLPSTLKRIGAKAFANCHALEVVLAEDTQLEYISPDAFWSSWDSVTVNLTTAQLTMMVQELHTMYIGGNDGFGVHFEQTDHFKDDGEQGHYESFAEYICVKEGLFGETARISAFELGIIYHEFAHHYQFIAMVGVGEETYDSLAIKPTQEEVEAWLQDYDKTNPDAYWNHPMEVSARAFAEEWTGIEQRRNN